jgi:hypothetical protein
MIDLNIASFLLSLLALLISFYTLYIERIIIEIKSIIPAMSGVKEMGKEWKHSISSIEPAFGRSTLEIKLIFLISFFEHLINTHSI